MPLSLLFHSSLHLPLLFHILVVPLSVLMQLIEVLLHLSIVPLNAVSLVLEAPRLLVLGHAGGQLSLSARIGPDAVTVEHLVEHAAILTV